MYNYLKLLYSNNFLLSILATIAQQIIVASSTYFIAMLAQSVVVGNLDSTLIVLFILSLTIVYLPSSLSSYYLSKAMYTSLDKYIRIFIKNFKGITRLRSDKNFSNKRKPFFCTESWIVIEDSLYFVSAWFSTIINVVLNTIVLSFVIDSKVFLAYLLAIPLIICSLKFTSKKIEKYSTLDQKKRAGMMQQLNNSWDSMLIGNLYNFNIWELRFKKTIAESKKTNLKTVKWVESVSSISMVLSLIPILGMALYYIDINKKNTVVLATIIATFPRQIQLIQYLSDIVYYATQWSGKKSKINGLIEATKPFPMGDREKFINMQEMKIKIDGNVINAHSKNDLANIIRGKRNGRITIRGRNGCGKSTLLSFLKEEFGKTGFYLPANTDLAFSSIDGVNLSSGENTKKILDEIAQNVKAKFLFLDEWDANFDPQMLSVVTELIESMSEKKVVVEIRHRHY